METNFIYFTNWTIQTCFLSYAHVSQAISLNFTQETKKCFKLQEDELKQKILNLHDEALVETIRMDIWNTWFGARTRMLWYFKNISVYKIGGSDLKNRRVWFSRIRPKSESWFLPYLIRNHWFIEWAILATYIYIGHGRL
jgi:hypothetical protein